MLQDTGKPMSPGAARSQQDAVPLCVDLDGTVIRTDVLWESLVLLLKRNPLYAILLPFWILRGRAFFKRQIASRTELDPATLPYNGALLEHLRAERNKGRTLILVSAADDSLAQAVARHLGLFSEVLASDGKTNLRGHNKGKALAQRFGARRFDYAGNSSVDLPVWREARKAIVVTGSKSLTERARRETEVSEVFSQPVNLLQSVVRSLRPHQWVKNLIVFVPLVTSHQLMNARLFGDGALVFIAFCLCASGVYMLNDLADLAADRQHPTKRMRPFAMGELPLPVGLVLAPILVAASIGLAFLLSTGTAVVLGTYLLLTTGYSWRFKQLALVDVFFLAALYTIRLVGGHAATGIPYSFWLLVFSIFIFLSLALLKRFTELFALRQQNRQTSRGRGYTAADLEMVSTFGIASGFLSVLVMALYVNSDQVKTLYSNPIILLLVCPLLLFWICRVWLIAHRGGMHDDPIIFALKDWVSYLIGVLTIGVLLLANAHIVA